MLTTATFKAQQKVWKCEGKEAGSETTGRREPTLEKPAAAMSSSESSSDSASDSSYSSTNGESGESVDGAENYKLAKQEMTLGSSTKDDS